MSDADEPRPTRFEPIESAAGKPFWDATRERVYKLPWCIECDRPHWFPREMCPFCLRPGLEWRVASGAGVVYAVSVMPKPGNPLMAGRGPYAVALVDLAEGVRVCTEVVSDRPGDIVVGQPVVLGWELLSDGRNLPVFSPRT